MVYCGRPSASCGSCRAKKRRCDKASPMCGQCVRLGQDCPGYRDPLNLVFRNETTRVIYKARKEPNTKARAASRRPSSPATSSSSARQPYTPVQQHDDDQAECQIEGGEQPEDEADVVTDPYFAIDPCLIDVPSCPAAQSSNRSSPVPSSSRSSSMSFLNPFQDIISPPSPPIPVTLPDMGLEYFLTNYVVIGSSSSSGYLEYTVDFLASASGIEAETVSSAMKAVGLAGMANTSGQTEIMREARSHYAKAMQLVNQALANRHQAGQDATILTIVILSLFESITCNGEESVKAWARHVDGIAALLAHRGSAQFSTPNGLHIFQEAMTHLITSCARLGLQIPPRIRLLRAEAAEFFHQSDLAWAVSGAFIEVMELFQRVEPEKEESPLLASGDSWEPLLSRVVEIDRDLESRFSFSRIQPEWRFKSVLDPAASSRLVHMGKYHVYSNAWMAKVWNGMRACRILANQVVQGLLRREAVVPASSPSGLSYAQTQDYPFFHEPYGNLLQRASDTIVLMRDDILASVPQLLGHVRHQTFPLAASHSSSASTSLSPNIETGASLGQGIGTRFLFSLEFSETLAHGAAASGGYFLYWFLYLAGTLPVNDAETKAWIVDRLRAIGSLMGIQKASYLADQLESGKGPGVSG